jgi:putative CocE/NonD family hydrolase
MSSYFNDPSFADNFISVKTKLDQQQTAGWTPGPPVMSGLGCRIHADQMIPVTDGISLGADIAAPAKPGRYPAVVVFSAYSHQLQNTGAPTGTSETGEGPVFADRGYVHVVVSRRGMGRSQGDSVVFFNETDVDDHVAVIEWAARQPWCDGQVVLFGTSYYAVVQPQVATRRPPALKAFFANGTDTDYFRQIVMYGGAPQVDFLTLWMGANFTEAQERLHVPPMLRAVLSHIFNSPLKKIWEPAVQKRMADVMDHFKKNKPALKYRQLFADWVFDGKTRATNSIPEGPSAQLHQIDVPFVIIEDMGAMNLHRFGAYELMQKAATPAERKWLIMAPPEYALPVYRWQLEALAFFDHICHGADNGYASQAPVRYYADGAPEGECRSASAYPVPGASKVSYYLTSSGADAVTHQLVPGLPSDGRNSWAAVPFRAVVPPGLDEVANPILTYDVTMNEDAEFIGPITLSLLFSCTEIDSHVIARLGRVEADGTYHLLSLGSMRPACRKIDELRSTPSEIALDIDVPEPLVPGTPVKLRFSLPPRPVALKRGERLRLDVGSRTDLLRSDVAHGFEQFDMMVPPYFSRNTLHYGRDTCLTMEQIAG